MIRLPERFVIESEIGRGGMAVVYRAHDQHLDRPVAIKVLRSEVTDAVGIQRFQREIGITAKLVHPGIVALFDSGNANGHLFYVMPFVSGDTLRARLTRDGRLSSSNVANIGADVAEALAYAHGARLVHRDIKPENIFLVEGRAVVADFGIAHVLVEQEPMSTTGSNVVVGTAAYMSPEQIEGSHDLDGRTDLYSLGCALYELLTGFPPFSGATEMAVLVKHMTQAVPSLLEHRADVSPELAAVVMRLLAKSRDDRIGSAAELAVALRSIGTHVSVERAPVGASATLHDASRPASSEVDRLVEMATNAIHRTSAAGAAGTDRLEEARAFLDRAIAIDPKNPRVLCELGRWYFMTAPRNDHPAESFKRGRQLVLEALAADDRLPEVHAVLGKHYLYHQDDFHAAERYARRAAELSPGDAEALRFLSIIEKILGRLDEAIATAQRATRAAPEFPYLWNALGDVLLAAGRNAEAAEALKRAIALQTGYVPALERMELARLHLGESEYAMEVRAVRLRVTGRGARAADLERDVATVGAIEARRADIRRELDELLEKAARENPFAEYYTSRTVADRIIEAYAELDEWTHAMDWVQRSFEDRPGRLRRVLTDQPFDRRGLAADPRYARLLRAAGLEELM